MVDQVKGELRVHIGQQSRVLKFNTTTLGNLEDSLGKDCLAHLLDRGGKNSFLRKAIFAGLAVRGADKKLTPDLVSRWLDAMTDDGPTACRIDDEVVNKEGLFKAIHYCIAGADETSSGREHIDTLDLIYSQVEGKTLKNGVVVEGSGEGDGPLGGTMSGAEAEAD